MTLFRKTLFFFIGIIVISHQMHDVFQVSDRMVIMRRGEKVAELVTAETNPDEVVGLIVGSETVTRAKARAEGERPSAAERPVRPG